MLIEFDQITRQFGNHTAVNDVSFSIDQGEIVGLLGHNGAGKTTIMKMLSGYLEATHGDIYVDGMQINDNLNAIQSRIGYLPENCPLWPNMSIVEFLLYQASLKGISKQTLNDQVSHVIQKTNLADKATQAIGTLSKGYRQRVGVANVILNNPKIIILDEPTNGLDPSQTLNMRKLIQELAKTSTVILSTHVLQEVEAVCDRVIIIRSGKVAIDSRLDVLTQIKGLNVTVDQDEKVMQGMCKDLSCVDAIQLKSMSNDQYQYLLDVDVVLAPVVSKKILEAGYQLFEITPDRKSLEAIFKQEFIADVNKEGGLKYVK